jgi:hypothetical protein
METTQAPLYYTALTLNSSNKKTGSIAVSTTSRHTCPDCCLLKGDGGCYADAGYHTRLHWDAVTAGKKGLPPEQFIQQIYNLPGNEMFRHNIAGDLWPLSSNSNLIDAELLLKLARASSHLYAAWTYTHHDINLDQPGSEFNRAAINSALENHGFVVNISTESLDVAARRAKDGFMVTVVQPEGGPTAFKHEGVRFVQCPATLPGSTITCRTCGGRRNKPLCATVRDVVVVFPVHGGRKTKAASRCS